MSKTFLFALSAFAFTLSTSAFAETKKSDDNDKHSVSAKTTKGKDGDDKHTVTLTTNTSKGHEEPATDIGSVSTKNARDFVANPTGVSFGGALGTGTSNSYGLGLGVRGGYTFPSRLYVGGIGAYHFGNKESFQDNSIRRSSWYVGPELGYDIGAGPLLVRPVMGLGLGYTTGEISGPGIATTNDTKPKLFLSPGAEVMYPIGNFYVGADGRYMYMRDNDAITLFATGGLHL